MAIRTFHHRDFPVERVAAAKRGRAISVCIPAKDEAATVGSVIEVIRRDLAGVVDEIVVLDDGSVDATAARAEQAGARVVGAASVLSEYHDHGGKGAAMWKAAFVAAGDLIVFCDADVTNFGARFVAGLVGPLLTTEDIGIVKATYDRPLRGEPGAGGRVTELVARPLISMLFPHLAWVAQPLAGECAVRREVLEALPFATGYGVELGLLVDAVATFGPRVLAQTDLGERVHRNRPLAELGPQAMAILQTAFDRAGIAWQPEWSTDLIRPGLPSIDIDEAVLPPLVDVPTYRRRSA